MYIDRGGKRAFKRYPPKQQKDISSSQKEDIFRYTCKILILELKKFPKKQVKFWCVWEVLKYATVKRQSKHKKKKPLSSLGLGHNFPQPSFLLFSRLFRFHGNTGGG